MRPFLLYLPTRLVFGPGRIPELRQLTRSYGRRALIVYGGGSVIRNGVLDQVRAALSEHEVLEFGGVEPNPKIGSVRDAARLCREKGVDFLVSVGGGSALDATKAIAAAARSRRDAWELVRDNSLIEGALPVFCVLTIAATGSDYDRVAVISNPETSEKLPILDDRLYPVAAILDPEITMTVPPAQTAAGSADIISHTLEQYLVREGGMISDNLCESVLRVVMDCTRRALADPRDYEARSELLLANSFGCCGLLCAGRGDSPWPCHAIEHELSAWYDITHGVGLAIITPHWMRYSLTPETAPRLARYARRVFGAGEDLSDMAAAERAIELTAGFFRDIGLPSRLSELGIDDRHFAEMARHITATWCYRIADALRPLDEAGIERILRDAL